MNTTTKNIVSDSNTIVLSDAVKLGLYFLQQKNTAINITLKKAETIVKNGKPYFHIINANKGFVIISPDSLYAPLLAYDSIGNFSLQDKDLNPGLIRWFNKHAHEIDFIRNIKTAYTDSIGTANKFLWKVLGGSIKKVGSSNPTLNASRTIRSNLPVPFVPQPTLISSEPITSIVNNTVGPLCTTFWNQNYPYNKYCPPGVGGHSSGDATSGDGPFVPAGCVPVAMAQIMYFWQYPSNYNWGSMVKDPSIPSTRYSVNMGGYTDAARLIHDIGITNLPTGLPFVSYGSNSSGATEGQASLVFSAFNYSSPGTIGGYSGSQTSIGSGPGNDSYPDILLNEISTYQRPCLLGGYPSEDTFLGLWYWGTGEGHVWVCDGTNITTIYSGYLNTYQRYNGSIYTTTFYDDVMTISLLRMNWGWGPATPVYGLGGPANDGWYNCDINYTTAPDGTDFRYFQEIIYNIHP